MTIRFVDNIFQHVAKGGGTRHGSILIVALQHIAVHHVYQVVVYGKIRKALREVYGPFFERHLRHYRKYRSAHLGQTRRYIYSHKNEITGKDNASRANRQTTARLFKNKKRRALVPAQVLRGPSFPDNYREGLFLLRRNYAVVGINLALRD